MSHLNPGLISAYNSLTDKHLAGYFSNTRIRRHLHRAGLITRSGRIVPDKEYRQKLIQRAHQRHVRECLAQAIFHKVLEMERLHQIEIKRKLEEFARRERVHKIKVERSKRFEEDIIRILSPHPPAGARGIRKQHSGPEGEHTESSESPGSSRPNTAPGKMQRPVRLKPLHSNSTTASHRHSSPYRRQHPPHHNQRPFNGTMDKDSDRRLNTMEVRNGISPYCLPVINNYVTPVPPSTRRKERPVKLSTSGTVRGRRLRPTTASSGADIAEEPASMLRSSVPQSRVCVNMVYLGKSVHLSNDLPDLRDEVKVFQQHCGGENLCIYKGKLREGESFQFVSRRHRGFPFSLTFFLNGLQVERLSSCCEFKHRKSSRLGGRHGHFAFSGVEAASPCYKCIIAMGLDKKPVPPPKRMKEDAVKMGIVPKLKVTAGTDTETTKEDPVSRSECESSPRKDTETTAKEERAPECSKAKDDYEEDFEADDEGPVEEEKEKKFASPNGERENKAKETEASDSEDSEKEGDGKSRSGSSCTGSDRAESDAEEVKEAKAEDKDDQPEEAPEEVQEEAPRVDTEAELSTEAEAKECEIQDSAGQSTEIEIGDSSVPSGNENRAPSDTHTSTEGERRTDESTQEEPERAKSVQEKIADAILKESHCSSEPELSDTSTETEASSNKSTVKETKVAEAVAETATGQLEVIEEEKKIEEPVTQEVTAEVQTRAEQEEIAEDNVVQNDQVSDKATSEVAKDADTGEKETSEEIVEEAKASAPQDEPKDEVREDGEATEPEAKSAEKEDESAASDLRNKSDESAQADNTEPLTFNETIEMKAEASDTQGAIGAEEGHATDTQGNDTQQEGEGKTREEGEVKTKTLPICENAKEESVVEDEETQREEGKNEGPEEAGEQSDLKEGEKEKTPKDGSTEDVEESNTESNVNEEEKEVAGTNLNPDEQNKEGLDNSEKGAEGMEDIKPKGELTEENIAEEKEVEVGLNTGQREDDTNKTSSEKDASEKPTEELEKTGQDGSQKEDTGKEKSDNEDEKNVEKDEGEAQQTEDEAQNNSSERADKEVLELVNPESTLQKEQRQETNADMSEDSAKLTEENVKSEDVVASLAGEVPKDTENEAPAKEQCEKENKDMSKEAEGNEVDAENGEASVVAEEKQTAGDEEKEETENTIDEPHSVTKVDENGKLEDSDELEKAELKHVNQSDSIEHDINDKASVLSNREENVHLMSKDLDAPENNNNKEVAQSNADKPTVEQVEAVDAFAAEGENGDTEEASKASEEGASVLLKPQVKSSVSEHISETEPKGSPEGLTTADSADLVTSWVTMHQTSKYFETFVEPLEEIREVNSEASNEQSSELPRSESPVKMVRGGAQGNIIDTKEETSEAGSNPSEAKQDGSTKDAGQADESLVLRVPNVENEENIKEPVIEESLRSKEDQTVESTQGEKILDSIALLNNNVTSTSIASSHLSITSGKQAVSEILNEEKASDHGQEANKVEDTKTEELPETLADLNSAKHTASEDAQENSGSKEVTADFTVSRSDSVSQQESHKTQDSRISGERRELIEGSSHTVSKEHLSSFSVDNALFGQSSHPLLTASKAENGH